MLDLGWTEIAIITVIALLVVGPKDLPGVVKSIGRWTGKARKQARDFQRSFENIAEDNELSEVRKEIEEANRELAAAGRIEDEPVASKGASVGANPGPRANPKAGDGSTPEATGTTQASATAASAPQSGSERRPATSGNGSDPAVAPPEN